MKKLKLTVTLVAAIFSSSLSADALSFYDNGVTPTTGVIAQSSNQLIADDFTTPTGITSLTGVTWSGVYSGNVAPAVDSFSVRIFGDVGGSPALTPVAGETVAATRTDTGTDLLGFDLYKYKVTLASAITLVPGATYWLSLFNETQADWFWGVELGGNSVYSNPYTNGIITWTTQGFAMDFSLSTTTTAPAPVPLPAGLPLLGAGLAGLFLFRRRTS